MNINKIIQQVTISLAVVLAIPGTASADLQTIYETYTENTRSLVGWKKRESSCKYAIAAAERKAIKKCKVKKHGKIVEVSNGDSDKRRKIIGQCSDCRLSKHFNEWYCTGKATVKCEYTTEVKGTGAINQMRGLVQKNKKVYTEGNNPCSKDTQTRACLDYRNALKKNRSQGVRD